MSKRSDGWPKRPKGFYEDWTVFCYEVLSARLRKGGEDLAVVLLAGGAILGGAGVVYLVTENKEAIDAKGREWGIEGLSTITGIGGAVIGATVSGLGVTWLMRMLGRHATTTKVDELQARLSLSRREFEAMQADCTAGDIPHNHHRFAVERLFEDLAST